MSDIEEWAVFDDMNRIVGLGGIYRTREQAEEYMAWLLERQEEARIEAEKNEAEGFKGGNEAYYRYNVGSLGSVDGGLKVRTYRIMRRWTTAWFSPEEE